MNGFILLIIYERIYLSNTSSSLGYGLKISLLVKSTNRWTVILKKVINGIGKKWDIVRYISFVFTRLWIYLQWLIENSCYKSCRGKNSLFWSTTIHQTVWEALANQTCNLNLNFCNTILGNIGGFRYRMNPWIPICLVRIALIHGDQDKSNKI